MPVTFGSGPVSASGTADTTLTSFHLDHTVNLMVNVTVDSSTAGFFVGLKVRTEFGIDGVGTSEAFNVDDGTVVSVPFYEIPEGFYDIVVSPLGGDVIGSFTASWANLDEL